MSPGVGSAFKRPQGLSLCLWITSVLTLLVSVFLWVGFPFIYKAIVYSRLHLSQQDDGQLTQTTWLWSKPPLKTLMKFYMFNVTNPDAIFFAGERPALVELGPFTFWEIEDKKEYRFNEDQSKVWYKNYKTYIYSQEHSCATCFFDSPISMPNLPALGALQDLSSPHYNVSEPIQQLFALGVLLLGEVPFISTTVGEVLFTGYNDAMLSAAHSELVVIINQLLEVDSFIPVPVPEMKRLAFFYGYNNSNDEEYWVETGKNDRNQIGRVISWANRTELPTTWYSTPQSRMINGTDSGSFSHPDLKKSDELQFFMSFMCRSFYLKFADEADVDGISTYEFVGPPSTFDTTLEENLGLRYPNFERVDYAKGWPHCPPKDPYVDCKSLAVNCAIGQNFCHSCCNGSLLNDTYMMPPGLYPVQCYPGRLEVPPFTVQFSPPHFAYSPPELANAVIGLSPNITDHVPFSYKYEPFSGTTTHAKLQFMVSTPMYNISKFALTHNLPQVMMPFTVVSAEGTLRDNTLSFLKLGFTTVPLVMTILKIVTVIAAIFLALFAIVANYRHYNENNSLPLRSLAYGYD